MLASLPKGELWITHFRLKKPMIGIMVGGAAGGIAAGLFKVCAYSYGYSTILALPIFVETAVYMLIAIIIDIAVAALVTYMLGFEDVTEAEASDAVDAAKTVKIAETKTSAAAEVMEAAAPVSGTIIAQKDIPDAAFSAGVLGTCVGIDADEEVITAPLDGVIETVTETGHAIGITGANGMEMLIHIGVDTVKMNGDGFETFVKEGEQVKKGQKLLKFDKKKIKAAGYPDTVVVIVTNSGDLNRLNLVGNGAVKAGETIFTA